MKAVILAGGRGTRLAPYTTVLPKPLMPLGNRPILEIIITQLRDSGFTEITLAVGYLAHLLQAYFGDGSRFGVNITYSFEETPLGTAGPLTLIDDIDEPVLVMNGDVLTNLDYGELYRDHLEKKAAITVSLYRKMVEISLGVLELDDSEQVLSYTEKPTHSYLASMGIYVVAPQVICGLAKGKRLDFPDLVQMLLEEGDKVSGYIFEGNWLDIGRPEDYAEAAKSIELLDLPEPSVTKTARNGSSAKQPA